MLGPRGYVDWVAIEERAEGGDALYQASQRDPKFLDGFERVAEGGGVALYRAIILAVARGFRLRWSYGGPP